MSVLIRDMEMPQYCGACHVGFCKQIGCDKHIGFDNYATSRHPECPLIEVPPHGDLIDRDALKENGDLVNEDMGLYSYQGISIVSINSARAVIEAEE